MSQEAKTYEYESEYGGTYLLSPKIGMYANNDNLSVSFDFYDKEEDFWEPFCSATINTIPLAYLEAAIDTNDNGQKILDFLEKNGFGHRTPHAVRSGFCVYPIFSFNEEKIKEIDPKVFAEYQKAYGQDKAPLADKVQNAQARAGKAPPEKQVNHKER